MAEAKPDDGMDPRKLEVLEAMAETFKANIDHDEADRAYIRSVCEWILDSGASIQASQI